MFVPLPFSTEVTIHVDDEDNGLKNQSQKFIRFYRASHFNTALRNTRLVVIILSVVFSFLFIDKIFLAIPPLENTIVHYSSSVHYNVTILTTVDRCNTTPDIDIVLLVKTGLRNFDRRQAIRETWGKEDVFAPDIITRTVFLVGLGNVNIDDEIKEYGDIVVGDFQDTYANLTFKSCMGLKWARYYCYNAKFFVKVDDDVYLNVKNLMKYLRYVKCVEENKYSKLYTDDHRDKVKMRRFFGGELFLRGEPIRNMNDRYGVTVDQFPYKFYPDYIGGPMCVMSRPVIDDFLKVAPITKFLHIEDVYFGFLANKAGVQAQNIPGVLGYPFSDSESLKVFFFISRHYVSVEQIRKLWEIQQNAKN